MFVAAGSVSELDHILSLKILQRTACCSSSNKARVSCSQCSPCEWGRADLPSASQLIKEVSRSLMPTPSKHHSELPNYRSYQKKAPSECTIYHCIETVVYAVRKVSSAGAYITFSTWLSCRAPSSPNSMGSLWSWAPTLGAPRAWCDQAWSSSNCSKWKKWSLKLNQPPT